MTDEQKLSIEEARIHFAKQTNGRTWELLEKTDRSRGEDEEMLFAAYASLYHWIEPWKAVRQQRGEWLVSRVHMALGHGPEALRHAERCLELTEAYREEMADFDIAYAYEGTARARAMAGDQERAEELYGLAKSAGETIADEEDREIFFGDFNGGDWYGLG